MGLSIGSASIAVSSLSSASASRVNRQAAPAVSVEEDVRLVQEPETPPIRAGFGENTLSPQGAALAALDSNLEAAEDIVPTVEELRERSRVIQAERVTEGPIRRPAERSDELRRVESVRPEPDAAVQNFVQDTRAVENERPSAESERTPNVAATSDVRTPGTTPPAAAGPINFFA